MPIEGKNEGDKRLFAVGDGLRRLRKDKGYSSYYEVAHGLHISPSQYWKYEKGANMTLLTLLAILDFLEISLGEFVNNYLETNNPQY